MRTRRRPRPAASIAAVVALALTLSGCAADDSETQAALESANERISRAEQRIQELEDEADRRVDLPDLRQRAEDALSGLGDASEDAQTTADELVSSLPSVDDVVDVEAMKEEGRVIVDYADDVLSADPAELEGQLRDAAERAKESMPDLKDVEFRVGDRAFTF